MRPIAVVPVKDLAEAKSRLGARLPADARQEMTLRLLGTVLAVLQESGAVSGRLVISPDPRVLVLAAAAGADGLLQRDQGLNQALATARTAVGAADAVLVVAGDLPLLTPAEVHELVASAPAAPGIVIAPDASELGTNLLLLRPAGVLPFAFGPGSFRRHLAAARAAGVAVAVHRSPGTAFDLDTPAQLDELQADHPARFERLVPGAVGMGLPGGGAA